MSNATITPLQNLPSTGVADFSLGKMSFVIPEAANSKSSTRTSALYISATKDCSLSSSLIERSSTVLTKEMARKTSADSELLRGHVCTMMWKFGQDIGFFKIFLVKS